MSGEAEASEWSLSARPWDVSLPRASTALICIDLQHDFCSVGGWDSTAGLDISACASVLGVVAALQAAARGAGVPVIHTREGHAPDLSDCPDWKLERSRLDGAAIGGSGPLGRFLIRGERGHAIVDAVAPDSEELIIDKTGKDAFIGTALDEELRARGITHILFTGVTTECCVASTLRSASDRGYHCILIEDACASPVASFHTWAVEVAERIFGVVTTADALLAALGR
jgi:nicotinamidase-related amidase